MNVKDFSNICYALIIVMLLVWGTILFCMGEFSNVARMIGAFIIGWYLRSIISFIKRIRNRIFSEKDKSLEMKSFK